MASDQSVRDMTTKFTKLEKFEGVDFRRWQKKMHFLLTTLKVVYVLSTPMPEVMEDETLKITRRRGKWENDDYICHDHILNGQYAQHDMKMDESISVSNIIDKLPPSWKDFKHMLKHKNGIAGLSRIKVEQAQVVVGKDPRINTHGKDDDAWWIDTGASSHVCKDRHWFTSFESVEDRSVLHMGNESNAPVLGRGLHSKAYRFYVVEPNDSIAIHTVIESRDALFDETRFSSIPRSKDLVLNTSVTSEVVEQAIVPTESPMLRRSKRGRIEKSFGPDFQVYLILLSGKKQ
ncbi:hypothetical protein L6452_02485 [Arctium lappa]|uniref:Uncharacterized protein n=1 Tax=Arctium lappa TaxID=4217 RepID=A0ACB9FIZ9_ARCLA|nr:hypothetical protein L6452_02485 [Arctium lappa]